MNPVYRTFFTNGFMVSILFLFERLMKHSGNYPKCGGTDIWHSEKTRVLGRDLGMYVAISGWRAVRLVPYICRDCGYSELHCDDAGLEVIEKHTKKKPELSHGKKCPICGTKAPENTPVCNECGNVLD